MSIKDDFIQEINNGVHWLIKREYHSLLNRVLNDHLSYLKSDKCQIVRNPPPRTVVSTFLNSIPQEEKVFIKVYDTSSFLDAIMYMFRKSKGMKEWEIGNKILRLGIPAPLPIAVGERYQLGVLKENYLIIQGIEDGRSLKEYLAQEIDPTRRLNLSKMLAVFIKEIHQRGILHRDLHAGNIIIKDQTGDSNEFHLIDLHNVDIRNNLSISQRLTNLAQINNPKVRKVERIKFIKEYVAGNDCFQLSYKKYARIVEKLTDTKLNNLWQRRDKRCLYGNKYFISEKKNGYKTFLFREYKNLAQENNLINPDHVLESRYCRICKSGRTTRSGIFRAKNNREIFIKRYNNKGLYYSFKNIFRTSRAIKAWKVTNGLILRGIPTPRPIMVLVKKRWRILQSSFMINEAISGAYQLKLYLKQYFFNDRNNRKALYVMLAKLLAGLHTHGGMHGDLKANNILVCKDGNNIKLFLVDLDKGKICKGFKRNAAIKDLARLNADGIELSISKTDRLQIFQFYLSFNPKMKEGKRKYLKEINRLTQRHIRRHQKKNVNDLDRENE